MYDAGQVGLSMMMITGKRLVVFLDYDGTLSPIVSVPDEAWMSDDMRITLKRLAGHCTTAIVTGRSRDKVYSFVQLDELGTSYSTPC